MITIGDREFRNLEEQVRRNQDDIQFILEEEGVLNQFGIKVIGQVDTEGELPDASTYQGDYGDAYAVGTQPPYELYIFTREFSGETGPQWFSIGQFPVPSTIPGPTGSMGPTGPTGQRGSKWTSSTSLPGEGAGTAGVAGDQYLYVGSNLSYNGNVYQYGTGGWELQGNIKGPQGIQGIQGPVGPTGPKGDVGPQGATGPVGQSFQIIGVLTTSSQLPEPSTVPDSYAYLVGSTGNYDLYVQVVGENEWVNVGKVEGVVGPQGPVGPTGTTGPAGIVYIKPVESNVIPVAGKGYNLLAMREFSSTPKVGDYFLLIWKGILDIEGRTWATIQEVTEIDGTRVKSVPSGVVETTGAQGEAGPQGPTGPAGATGPMGPTGPAGEVDTSQFMKLNTNNIASNGDTKITLQIDDNQNAVFYPVYQSSNNYVMTAIQVYPDSDSYLYTPGFAVGTNFTNPSTFTLYSRDKIVYNWRNIALPNKEGVLALTSDIPTQYPYRYLIKLNPNTVTSTYPQAVLVVESSTQYTESTPTAQGVFDLIKNSRFIQGVELEDSNGGQVMYLDKQDTQIIPYAQNGATTNINIISTKPITTSTIGFETQYATTVTLINTP